MNRPHNPFTRSRELQDFWDANATHIGIEPRRKPIWATAAVAVAILVGAVWLVVWRMAWGMGR